MASDLTINKVAACIAKTEGAFPANYGVQPTIDPSALGFLTNNSPIPVQPEQNVLTTDPHAVNVQRYKDVPTTRANNVTFNAFLLGGAAADGPPRTTGILTCSGFKETINVATSVVYTLITDLADFKSSTFAVQEGGFSNSLVREVNGMWARTLVIAFRPTTAPELRFNGRGLFQDPQAGTIKSVFGGGSTEWSGGTNNANHSLLTGANQLLINNGGTDYVPRWDSIEITITQTIDDILDGNAGATYGLDCIAASNVQASMVVKIMQEPNPSANITYGDLFDDADAATSHQIDWDWADLGGRTFGFSITDAQPLRSPGEVRANHRLTRIEYKLLDLTITHT